LAVERKGEIGYCFGMSSRRSNEDSAFTLIELLTLAAIIGILAALLLAAITRGKGPAQRIQCANNVRHLGLALQEFVADNHVYPLFANVDFHKGGYPEHHGNWVDALEHEKIASQPGKTFFETGVWRCPAARRPSNYPTNAVYMSYGYNAYGLDVIGKPVSLGLGGHKVGMFAQTLAPPVNQSEVAAPNDMMAIGDVFDGGAVFWREVKATNSGIAYSRHQGEANVVFCDGHVESPTLKFLFEETNDAALVRWNRDHRPHREKLIP
jgi:prepilin-type processing-associated H-X9-DG protein